MSRSVRNLKYFVRLLFFMSVVIEKLSEMFEYIFQRSDLSIKKPEAYDLAFAHEMIKTEVKPIFSGFGLRDVRWFYDRKGKVHFIDLKPEKEIYITTYDVDERYAENLKKLRKKGYKVLIYPWSFFVQLGEEIAKVKAEFAEKGIEIDVYKALGIEPEYKNEKVKTKVEEKKNEENLNRIAAFGITRKKPLILEGKIKETIEIAKKRPEDFPDDYLKALANTLLCVTDGILVSVDYLRKENELKEIVDDLAGLCKIKSFSDRLSK